VLALVAGQLVKRLESIAHLRGEVGDRLVDLVEQPRGAPHTINHRRELGLGVDGSLLEPLGPLAALAVGVLAVECADRVVLDEVEPATDERVADLELVVEILEGQLAIERLDPQGETCKLDSHRIAVDAVETALDDITRES
jgi:hypothetical protein